MFYKSGYIIQAKEDSKFCTNEQYQGAGKKISWPLNDEIQKELDESWENNFLANLESDQRMIELIVDKEMLTRYTNKCKENKLNIRILFVEIIEGSIDCASNKYQLLGYDLIYPSSWDYSAVVEEREFIDKAHLDSHINKYGLFENEENLNDYIEWRSRNTNKLIGLEPIEEFVKIRTYLMKDYE